PILDGRRTRIGQGPETFEVARGKPKGGEPSDPQELATCRARSPRFRPFPEDRKHGAAPLYLSHDLCSPILIGTPSAWPVLDSVRDDSKPNDVVVIGRCPAGPLGDAAMTRLVQERTPADDAAGAARGA